MKKTLIKISIFTIAFWSIIRPASLIFAQDNQYPYEKISPKSGYRYTFKRLKEKLTLLVFSVSKDRKAEVYKKLANIRLAELKEVVEKKDMANFENATKRYYTSVGQYVEYITINKQDSQKEEAKKLLEKHGKVLDTLKEEFNDTTAEWRFLKHDSDYLELYSKIVQEAHGFTRR